MSRALLMCRWWVLSLVMIQPIFMAANVSADTQQKMYQVNIVAGTVAESLNQLSEQINVPVFFSYTIVKAKQANAVSGQYTLQEVLQIMLQGTGLYGGLSDTGVLTVSLGSSQATHNQGEDMMNRMMNRKKNILASTIAFFVGAGGVQGLAAEEVGDESKSGFLMEEVVVTAQKREQRLLDVPISISVVSDKDMKLPGIDNMTDLSYYVPNLTVTEDSPGDQQVKIRGVSNANGQSPLVGIYLDELPLRLSIGAQIDIPSTDIERVEVLKGPQGTLFGQGAVGGVLRYISKKPSFEGFAGDVSAKTYSTKGGDISNEITAAANIPVSADKLAFRVAASYKNKGGWIDQFPTGGDNANDEDASNIRIRGLFQATENFTIDTTAIRNRSESGGPNIVNIGSISDSKYYKLTPALEDRGGLSISPERTYDYEVYNISASYDFGFATLLSSTTKYDIEVDEGARTAVLRIAPGFHIPESDLLADLAYLRSETHAYGQEIRLSGDTDTLNWTVGLQYADAERMSDSGSANSWLDDNLDILFGFPVQLYPTLLTSESVAVFSDVSYDLTNQLTVSVGARYYEDDIEFSVGTTKADSDFENLSLKGSLSYALTDQANVYFTIAEGFRSGGVNVFGDAGPYDPESLISYEFGGKAILFDGRFSVDAAAYFSDYDDYQAQETIIVAGSPQSAIRNPGKAEIKGIEWTLSAHITDQFNVGFNGHISEGEFTEVAENPPTFLSGDPLSGVPKYSYSVSADYNFNWSSSIEGFAHVNYSRHGESAFTNRGIAQFYADREPVNESPAVGYLGAQIGAKWNALTLRLFGKNLNNELREPNEGDPIYSLQRRPRSIGIEASYSF